ncbi:hypothetical protein D3C79_810550 [compost metagenome]
MAMSTPKRSKASRATSSAAPITSGWLQLNNNALTPSSAIASAAAATVCPERRRGTSTTPSSSRVNDTQNGLPSCGRCELMARTSSIELWVSANHRST